MSEFSVWCMCVCVCVCVCSLLEQDINGMYRILL